MIRDIYVTAEDVGAWIGFNYSGLLILTVMAILGILALLIAKRRRWLIALSAALLLSAAAYGLSRFTNLPVEVLANIWVAAGTLLLGVVTALSVYETTAVIRSEDKRHMQGYAPLLTLEYPYYKIDKDGRYVRYPDTFLLSNIGKGVALNASVSLTIAVFFEKYESNKITEEQSEEYKQNGYDVKVIQIFPPGGAFGRRADAETLVQASRTVTVTDAARVTFFIDAVADRMDGAQFPLPKSDLSDNIARAKGIMIDDVTMRYTDMFGNPYETNYTDGLKRYRWERPKYLQ